MTVARDQAGLLTLRPPSHPVADGEGLSGRADPVREKFQRLEIRSNPISKGWNFLSVYALAHGWGERRAELNERPNN